MSVTKTHMHTHVHAHMHTHTQLRQIFLFRPEDEHDLHQVPPARFQKADVEHIKGYRYPAPG